MRFSEHQQPRLPTPASYFGTKSWRRTIAPTSNLKYEGCAQLFDASMQLGHLARTPRRNFRSGMSGVSCRGHAVGSRLTNFVRQRLHSHVGAVLVTNADFWDLSTWIIGALLPGHCKSAQGYMLKVCPSSGRCLQDLANACA